MATLLHSYKIYKALEHKLALPLNGSEVDFEYSEAIKKSAAINVSKSSFLTKLKGSFYAIAGNLSTPGYNEDESITSEEINGPRFKEITRASVGLKFKRLIGEPKHKMNHAGLYDYATFGILYALEWLVRGNWSNSPNTQLACKVFFSTLIPILPVLFLARNIAGLIAALPASLVLHVSEWVTNNIEERQLVKGQYEVVFHGTYNRFKVMLNPEKYAAKYPDPDRVVPKSADERASKAVDLWKLAKQQLREMEKTSAKYQRRFIKLNQNGKYGSEAAVKEVVHNNSGPKK